MRTRSAAGFVVSGALAIGTSAWAHHAHGNYALATVDMEGVVSEVHLLNPHSWLYLEVTRDGRKEIWALEGATRTGLISEGVTADYVKANLQRGDKVKVRCHPLSDGSPGCLLGLVKAKDGIAKNWDANPAGAKREIPKDF